ncbi:MAG: hypothetical protein M3394_06985, partial [Actinomycetota bacterium]|nr:hypothetical protein [Actinomycetota bacterium]
MRVTNLAVHPGRVGRLLLALFAFTAVVGAGAGQRARADTPPVEVVGRFVPTMPPGFEATHAYVHSPTRRLYAMANERVSQQYVVAPHDVDSLESTGPAFVGAGMFTAVLPDTATGGLFVASESVVAGREQPKDQRIDLVVGSAAGARRVASIDLSTTIPGRNVMGLYRHPRGQVLWALATSVGDLTLAPVLMEIDIRDIGSGRAQVSWLFQMDGCVNAAKANPQSGTGFGYVPGANSLYLVCGNLSASITSPNPRGVARVPLVGDPTRGPTTAPTGYRLFPMPADVFKSQPLFDPSTDRLLIPGYTSSTGSALYVFDARTDSYVGAVATGGTEVVQSVVDPVKSRYYGLATSRDVGLVVADTAPTPIRQGIGVPALAMFEGKSPQFAVIGVDSPTSRLFARYIGLPGFVILVDHLPRYSPPYQGDPDAATVDVEEQAGRTQSTFAGGAQAYGARYRAPGLAAVVMNAVGFGSGSWPIGPGTRESRFSSLEALTMGNNEATAAGISALADEGTEADIGRLAQPRDQDNEPLTEKPVAEWPYGVVRCADFGSSAQRVRDPGTDSEVTCDGGQPTASATFKNKGGDSGGITVGPTSVVATLQRNARLGSTAEVTSTAEGISVLGGVLKVGRVTTTAAARAKGRPGTAAGTFSRAVHDVTLGGAPLCSGPCNDLAVVADTINTRLAGRARISFPQPQGTPATPGGYQAVVQRATTEHIEEMLFNEQAADRYEVPGMVVTVYHDGTKPGRVIAELAGVQAEARYGITLLDEGIASITDPPSTADRQQQLASLAGVHDAPLFGATTEGAFPTDVAPLRPVAAGGQAGGSPTVMGRAAGLIATGLRGALRVLPVWALLLGPVYLS